MSVTLKDVAGEAKVSTSLVSQYLTRNPSAKLRDETKKRIDDAVEKLGYRPSAIARSLRRGKTRTLGMVVASLQNRFFGLLADLVLHESKALGYQLLISHCEYGEDEVSALNMLLQQQVDGCFQYLQLTDEAMLERLRERKFPMIMMNQQSDGFLSARRDYRSAIEKAVKFMKERGSSVIYCIDSGELWRAGMEKSCVEHGIKLYFKTLDPNKGNALERLRTICRKAPEVIFCYGWATTARLIRLIEEEFPTYEPAIITNIHFDFTEMRNPKIKGAIYVDLPLLVHHAMQSLVNRIEGRAATDVSVKAEFFPREDFPATFNTFQGGQLWDFY